MPRNPALESHHFEALGTSCSVFGFGISPERLIEGEAWVRRLGARLTRFSPASELSKINDAGGRWVAVSADTEEVLRLSLRAFEMSGGLVNVAVLPSMLAIGYTRTLSDGASPAILGRARPLPALPSVLSVRRGGARLEPGCGIDLGGIAKGWMADRLRERLGINALANLGGDLSAGGPGPSGGGWPVGMAGTTVMLRDQGAATSSVRRRRWAALHHLISPSTGLPAATGLEEVSVVAHTGFDAEVIAKTALLVGPDVAHAFCATHALAWWLSSTRDSAAA